MTSRTDAIQAERGYSAGDVIIRSVSMVFKRMLKRVVESAAPPALIPAGQRVYAIGDIHGRLDLLDDLLAQIDADDAARPAAETILVILGDLVDRGPDSAGVVQRLLDLSRSGRRVRFLSGNHEEVFIKALGDKSSLRFFSRIGGRSTIISYGIPEADYDALDFDDLGAWLAEKVPADHIAFLEGFEDQVRIGDYLFVHAGIRPGVAFEEQTGADLRWIRSDFLDHRGHHGVMVVHGHTITEAVDERSNRIGIDTGAYDSGVLTAIGLEGAERWYLATA